MLIDIFVITIKKSAKSDDKSFTDKKRNLLFLLKLILETTDIHLVDQ